MAIIRATAVLEHLSGKPTNASRNVWHFTTAGAPNDTVLTKIGDNVGAFYTAIGAYIGVQMNRNANAHRVELAAVTQGAPGEDDDDVSELLGSRPFGIPAAGGSNLPSEVAVALSFQGDVSGVPEEESGGLIRPRASRRGRVYLGPLGGTTIAYDGGGYRVIVAPAFRTAVLNAYAASKSGWGGGTNNARHVIYSRKQAVAHPVTKIWVDDAFDVVRSRGEASAARSVTANIPVDTLS